MLLPLGRKAGDDDPMQEKLGRCSLLIATLAIALTVAACGGHGENDHTGTPVVPGENGGSGGEWPAFFDLDELVEATDAIVLATLEEEDIETVGFPLDDGGAYDSVTEVLRTFHVDEPLAGSLTEGDYFTRISTASVAHHPADDATPSERVFQVLDLEEGGQFILFLSVVPIPEGYPEEWGNLAWASPGEPHTARLHDDESLSWLTTGRYDDAREARDLAPGAGGAGSAFDTDLDGLRGIVAEHFESDFELDPGDEPPAGDSP